ncbi:sialidase-1 [Arcanobacterium phocae]|uniref:exo-alpha-sialidase n=1 Tax=Arcanobacterium phocae TaxID=131112 RepID=A0A1H2LCR2_9ACTO|nr:sialidase family protein [Arcanobacterium phocae]SDU78719.1 sialidase-1 [Arcanobacterium phocae]
MRIASKLIATVATAGLLLLPALPAYGAEEGSAPELTPGSQQVVTQSNIGMAKIILNAPEKGDAYSKGEKIEAKLRFESGLHTKVHIVGSSKTFTGSENCNWSNFPAAEHGGRFDCKVGAQQFKEIPSYIVTEADEERGWVTLDFTFTANSISDSSSEGSVTVTKSVKVYKSGEAESVPEDPYRDILLAKPGSFGYTCHRIPALAKVQGRLIAAWDGRPGSCQDAPNPNSIIMRYSDDNGKSWSGVQTIAQGKLGPQKYGYSDPSFVVDEETGTIFAFFVKSFDAGIAASEQGTNPGQRSAIHTVYTKSDNKGQTWSEPVLVTEQVSEGQRQAGRFAASGQGIQLKYGKFKGRLIQQYTVVNDGNWKLGKHQAVSLYSDDHGETWQVGTPVGGSHGAKMDENKVVELSDGRVLLSSRPYEAGWGGRHYAISDDGGQNYTLDQSNDQRLKDPRNNASILRAFPDAPMNSARAKILFSSHANSTTNRQDGVVSYSFDDGKTWGDSPLFKSGAMSYSTMTPLGDGEFGILYEGDNTTIMFKKVDFAWLGLNQQLSLLSDVVKAETDAAMLTDQVAQKDKELGAKNAELRKASEEKAQLESDKAQLVATKAKLEADNAKLVAEKATLEADKAQAQSDLAAAEAKVAKLEADLATAQGDAKKLTANLARAEAAKVEFAKKFEEKSAKLDKKIADLENKKQELQTDNDKAVTDLKVAQDKISQLEERNKALVEQKEELEKEIKELKNKPEVSFDAPKLTPATPIKTNPDQPEQKPVVAISSDSIEPGSDVVFTATGFQPGEEITFSVHSNPVVVGSVKANPQGIATITWHVPTDFVVGNHHVEARGKKVVATAELTVVSGNKKAPQEPQKVAAIKNENVLAKTGAQVVISAGIVVLLLSLGSASLAARRRSNS